MYLMSKKKSQKTSDEYIHKHKSYYYTTNERCFALDRFLIWKQNILLFFLITEALNCRMHQPQSVGGCYCWIFKSFISNLWPLQCATPKKYFEWKTKNTAFRNAKRTWYDFLSKKNGKPSLTRQPNFVAEWRGSLVLDKKMFAENYIWWSCVWNVLEQVFCNHYLQFSFDLAQVCVWAIRGFLSGFLSKWF